MTAATQIIIFKNLSRAGLARRGKTPRGGEEAEWPGWGYNDGRLAAGNPSNPKDSYCAGRLHFRLQTERETYRSRDRRQRMRTAADSCDNFHSTLTKSARQTALCIRPEITELARKWNKYLYVKINTNQKAIKEIEA